jgi:solute carrier family 35 protein F1/2
MWKKQEKFEMRICHFVLLLLILFISACFSNGDEELGVGREDDGKESSLEIPNSAALIESSAIARPPPRNNFVYYAGGIVLGQVLSAAISGASFVNSVAPMTFPIIQNGVFYPMLLMMVGSLRYRYLIEFLESLRQKSLTLQPVSYYAFAIIMGVSDVGANVLLVKAFQYTSALSATLISSLSTVFVIVIAALLLKIRYGLYNYGGAALCLIGLGLIMGSRVEGMNPVTPSITGSMMALGSAVAYAISNVFNERLAIVEIERYPFAAIASMGLVGTIGSIGTIASPWGQDEITRITSVINSGSYDSRYSSLFAYPFLMLFIYSIAPKYFQWYSVILFNFNILTAGLYVFIYDHFFTDTLGTSLSPLSTSGVVLVFIGLLIYSSQQPMEPFKYDYGNPQ